jgi:cysteine desulfurase
MDASMPIYLDYNATTPVDPAVLEAMLPYLREHHGNPSSTHAFGTHAHAAVETARTQVADLIGAKPQEIVFTGGGTEASNLAIKGVAFGRSRGWSGWLAWLRGGLRNVHLIHSSVEHPATTQPCSFLAKLGVSVTVIPVDGQGRVDPEAVRRALRSNTALVSIMHSNNEVGTLQPIAEISKITRELGVPLHVDAAQSLGKVAVDVRQLGIDLLTIAGHKLYAPKGVGVLYVREGLTLEPVLHGAGHESGRRAGTENVPYIVGLGAACAIARASLPAATERQRVLRERLWQRLQEKRGDRVSVNGHPTERLPNTLNVNFVGDVGAELLARVPEVAASTGSACHEGKVAQSPVLCAMRVPPEIGKGAVRLSVGRFTTEAEVEEAADLLASRAR